MGRGRNWLVAGVAGLVALVGALTFLTDAVADSRELLSGVTEAPGIKVVRGRVGGPAETPYGVRGGAPLSRRIEVLVDAGRAAEVEAVVRGLGGVVVASSPSVVLVEVSLSSLDDLVAIAGVERIREPVVVDLPPAPDVTFEDGLTGGQLPSAVDADAWHAEGHTGHGVRIGVIDGFDGTTWTMAQDAGSVPVPAGTFCMFIGSTCDVWLGGTAHGVAVAEGIHSIAPGSSLYLASVGTVTDYYAAIDWFAAQGVTIVSRSLGSLLDGPGDGSGPMDAVADYAVSQGMVWFNSAGNHAARSGGDGQYWRGPWVDGDSDGWIEFAPDDELMGMWCDSQIQGFRWSDWSGNATDYDVYLFSGDGMDLLAGSERDQTAGATPLELLSGHAIDCDANPVLQVGVHLHDAGNGTSGDVLEMMVNLGGLEHAQDAYSASGPVSDSSNPAVMSVGALDPGDGITIAPYSSQGPTNDGRVKPDVAAPACYPTTAYPDYCFAGTSAAAPVAAGSAALVRGAGVASTPTAIASYLRTHALDRGAPG
ncbi:MAG: S8 family serine peptidase, partial [Acidimicrobiia bacterium]|nr:S8 family serine peptidase [Acidimicrobiia bacterium]